jgi:hypothetical protein
MLPGHAGLLAPTEVIVVTLSSLWLPILLSAVVVFFVSYALHTVLPLHKDDFKKLPREDEVISALRPFAIPPGSYNVPHAATGAEMRAPEFQKKIEAGPVALLTVRPNGMPGMGKLLGQWFVYCLVVTIFAAYVTSHAVPFGGHYRTVFRYLGATAFMGYSFALVPESIWFGRPWKATWVSVLDGLIYALLSAGVFGWLWPR